MWELGGLVDGESRVMCGIGAWWEPIASRVGENRRLPLRAMREHVEALRALFTMEEVTYEGEIVQLDRVRLDVAYGDTSPRDIPIYIGATGPKMLELTGETCDGVVLNYVVSTDYIRSALSTLPPVPSAQEKQSTTLIVLNFSYVPFPTTTPKKHCSLGNHSLRTTWAPSPTSWRRAALTQS